jgi:glycosyltransferase involved in cell wall biosynthesis
MNSNLHSIKKILLLNDFPVSEAIQGGEIRINRLFTSLSIYYDIKLLCLSNDNKVTERNIIERFREIRIPKTEEHHAVEEKFNALHAISVNDIVSAMMCEKNELLLYHFYELVQKSDIVIFEHPYMIPLLDYCKVDFPIIYESHNVESILKEKILCPRPDHKKMVPIVNTLESLACEKADRIVCVSENDYSEFSQKVEPSKLRIVRNGVSTDHECININKAKIRDIKFLFSGYPVAVFIGSAHPPNVQATHFIIDNIAPRLPFIYFIIIGSACHCLYDLKRTPNVLLWGIVDDEVKNTLFSIADIALNPTFSGGGSNLKIADYFAASLPVISTLLGMRGFNIMNNQHIIQAEPEEFVIKICELLTNSAIREKLKTEGRSYAQQYLDWNVLAKDYRVIIDELSTKR